MPMGGVCISEREQLKAFVKFIKSDRIKKEAAIKKDWRAFAKRYNGRYYRANKYDTKLKEAYERHAK